MREPETVLCCAGHSRWCFKERKSRACRSGPAGGNIQEVATDLGVHLRGGHLDGQCRMADSIHGCRLHARILDLNSILVVASRTQTAVPSRPQQQHWPPADPRQLWAKAVMSLGSRSPPNTTCKGIPAKHCGKTPYYIHK